MRERESEISGFEKDIGIEEGFSSWSLISCSEDYLEIDYITRVYKWGENEWMDLVKITLSFQLYFSI